jgi:arylsulfatase A-like enzyme
MDTKVKFGNAAAWIAAVIFLLAVSLSAQAAQYDAEHYELEKQFGDQWLADDKKVRAKLAELEKKFGKKPNIIKILVDDVGYSELGVYGGGKLRGAPTPNLDKLAKQGMRFTQYYSEVSCTPSRIALNTGRHNVRVGVNQVDFPGTRGMGLPKDEVTLAELLSKAGYHTAMFGKWHVGFGDQYAPTEHGFDEAEWSEGNPAVWIYGLKGDDMAGHVNSRAFNWAPKLPQIYYDEGGVMRAKKGQKPELVYPYSIEKYNTYDTNVADLAIDYIKRHADSDNPFFLYVGGKGNHFYGANPDFKDTPAQTNTASQMTEHDYNLGRIIKTVQDQGIAENTLVVWSSDNGPMYGFHPHGGYSMFDKGEKGQTWEGGVRVPAIAWWPGVIEQGQEPLDIVHITDWYTTFASIAGVKNKIPNDRVVDGVDQTALFMLGEDHGRRDYVFLYAKGKLESVRKDWFKMRFGGTKIFPDQYNLMHDPAERYPKETNYTGYTYGLNRVIEQHNKLIEKFPHTVQTPYQREPDRPFNPSPSLSYEAAKQVTWE